MVVKSDLDSKGIVTYKDIPFFTPKPPCWQLFICPEKQCFRIALLNAHPSLMLVAIYPHRIYS